MNHKYKIPSRSPLRITAKEVEKPSTKDLQGLVSVEREQGYLTFDQVNDFLPHDVALPGDLRAALESFEGMDTKGLDEVPGASTSAAAKRTCAPQSTQGTGSEG